MPTSRAGSAGMSVGTRAGRRAGARILARSVNRGDNPGFAGCLVPLTMCMRTGGPHTMTEAASECHAGEGVAKSLAKHVVDALPIPLFAIDHAHRVVLWNVPCQRLTGMSEQCMLGRTGAWPAFYSRQRPVMADLVLTGSRPEDLERYYAGKYRPSASLEDAWELEEFFPRMPDGGKWLVFSAAALHDESGVVVGLESQHHHRRGVRRARQTETVRIFDAQAVDGDDFARAVEVRVLLQLVDQRKGLAFTHGDVQLRR